MTAAVLPDIIPALRAYLAASALASQVTGGDVATASAGIVRVYSDTLPTNPIASKTIPGAVAPAIVVAPAGGGTDRYLVFKGSPRVEIRTYAISRESARTLWYAVLNFLLANPIVSGTLWAEVGDATLPSGVQEPGTGYFMCTGMAALTVMGH